ncbi:Iridoid oxidase [Linum grandiflorum]
MSELILNPESMKRVQHELTEVIKPDSVVEESDISNLPFLHAVVKETLRLHPVAPLLLPRSPTESCHVGGYTIPEGAKVFLNVWAMHRDPDYWTNPSSFCPGRFVNEGLDYMGNNFHYLPFGSGRRFCAGFQLGEKMVMYVLATFLHMFDWEVPEDVVADTEEKFGVVLEKVTPLILIPSPRLSNPNFYCS